MSRLRRTRWPGYAPAAAATAIAPYEGIVNGTIQDILTTPVMLRAMVPTGWPILATR